MKTQSEIERLADEALKSINGIQQVEANSFLFTRIEAKMMTGNYQQNFAAVKYLSGLSVALVVFIGLNISSYYLLSGNGNQPEVKQKATAAQAFASEYNLSTNQYNY